MKKPVLITTLGYPGSGKTYFAEHLSKEKGFFHINADKVRHTIFENPQFTLEETQCVVRLMEIITEDLLKMGVSVIYDANNNFKIRRKRLEKIGKKCGAQYWLLWIQTDISIAEKRIVKRSSSKRKNLLYPPLAIEILHKLKDQIEPPTASEPVIVVDGRLPFAKQFAVLKKGINL